MLNMFWLIDTCQNNVSADPSHWAIMQVQAKKSPRSHVDCGSSAGLQLDPRLMIFFVIRVGLFGSWLMLTQD